MPNYYNYNPYQMYQPFQTQQVQQAQQMPQVQPQIQNGGFVSVRSEDEAKNYPVAQGMSVTFKNETAPYIYTKTMGFSQLDRPMFEKFKLVKEEAATDTQTPENEAKSPKPSNDTLDEISGEIKAIWSEIDAIKEQAKKSTPRRSKDGDD